MRRSFLPFILVSLGFALILWAMAMPLLEWQTSEIVTNFPSTYEVHISQSPWNARISDSFDDEVYIYKNISVLKERRLCYNKNIDVVIERPQRDKALEQKWQNFYDNVTWLFGWSLFEVVLSGFYIWWFVIWYKRDSPWKAIGLTMFAIWIFLNLIPRMTGPLFPRYFAGEVDCYHGTITFNAVLSKIHYETLIVFFIGVLVELGALVLMVRQIIKTIIERKGSVN